MHKQSSYEAEQKLAEELLKDKKSSFAKMFYQGALLNPLFSSFPLEVNLTDEEEQLILAVRQFAEEKIDPDRIDRTADIPQEVTSGLATLGVMGMTIPKEYGGLGLSQTAFCAVVELLASYCSSTALFVNAHQSIGLRALLLFGTKEQKEKWLPPLARGKWIAAFSLTEKNAGSDAGGIETTAHFDTASQSYILNGRKQWTTNGSIADFLTVLAKTEDGKTTAFIVTPDMPGFSVQDGALEKTGYRGTKTSNLLFSDMRLPKNHLLGQPGQGLKICLTVLDYGRCAFAATCVGVAKDLQSRSVKHATMRHQFKRPLASFPLIKKKVALVSSFTFAMDRATKLTAWLIDSGGSDFMLEAAILKVFASEALWNIIYESMQILGGRSFFCDEPYERRMRDARLNMIGEGANEVLRVFIALVGLRDVGEELKGALKSPKALWGLSKRFLSLFFSVSPASFPPTDPATHALANKLFSLLRRFGRLNIALLAKYREGLLEEQLILDNVATLATAFYTSFATLLFPPSTPEEGAMQRFYLNHAVAVIEEAFYLIKYKSPLNKSSDLLELNRLLTGN